VEARSIGPKLSTFHDTRSALALQRSLENATEVRCSSSAMANHIDDSKACLLQQRNAALSGLGFERRSPAGEVGGSALTT
jgi:hypothetical protein